MLVLLGFTFPLLITSNDINEKEREWVDELGLKMGCVVVDSEMGLKMATVNWISNASLND